MARKLWQQLLLSFLCLWSACYSDLFKYQNILITSLKNNDNPGGTSFFIKFHEGLWQYKKSWNFVEMLFLPVIQAAYYGELREHSVGRTLPHLKKTLYQVNLKVKFDKFIFIFIRILVKLQDFWYMHNHMPDCLITPASTKIHFAVPETCNRCRHIFWFPK